MAFRDSADRERGIHFEVAKVMEPLVSIAQMVGTDHVVVLRKAGGLVYNPRTKQKIRLPRVGNKFYMDMKLPAPEEEEKQEEQSPAPAFRRPE